MNNRIAGRVCFLITNVLNLLSSSFSLYKMIESGKEIHWTIEGLFVYFCLHSLFGIVCTFDQDRQLLTSFKISCYFMGAIQGIILIVSIIGAIYFGFNPNHSSVGDALIFLVFCAAIAGCLLQILILYANFKYITSILSSLSNQYFLGISNPSQQIPINQNQPMFHQGYFIQYPQMNQQFPQQNGIEFKQQTMVQPMQTEVLAASAPVIRQPLILPNGYTQFQ